jgi:hypothetical protein
MVAARALSRPGQTQTLAAAQQGAARLHPVNIREPFSNLTIMSQRIDRSHHCVCGLDRRDRFQFHASHHTTTQVTE